MNYEPQRIIIFLQQFETILILTFVACFFFFGFEKSDRNKMRIPDTPNTFMMHKYVACILQGKNVD